MLGLSIGTDSGVPKLGRNNHKSYNFAASNIGRFHTSGVSGSMKKHTAKKTKEKLGDTDKSNLVDDQDEKLRQLKDRSKNYVPERLEARQKEIEEDTMKLLELEKKLDEVKRQKELKRRRDEARAMQRLQYSSVLKIQRRVRRWLLRRHMRAATALQAFLKFAAAKQAVAAATWAIATLREFVQMIELKQLRYNEVKKAARSAAASIWSHVEKKSAAGVMEARKQAVMIASRTIQVGIRSAALQKQHKKRTKKISMFASSPKGIASPKARAAKLWALLRKRVVPVHFKFHDTAYRRRTVFTDGYVNPAKDMDHPNYRGTGALSMAEVCLQVAERKKRSKMEEVMRLHKQREEAMAQERVLRLQMIEEDKKKKELEQTKHEQQSFINKAKKEKSKVDFLRRVETEQIERAKVVNQVREKKEKVRREREAQAKREQENEAQENKLMYAEDIRFFQNLEKVRKQRLKDYATKRKSELDKAEKDHQPGPNQVTSGPGYLSARGAGGGGGGGAHEGMTQHEIALEEERKMHVWAAHDNAMRQRLAARRAAEKEEKRNAELEQEMIRKEKELVAMKAQLMMKRAAFMKAKAKKLKDQAQENSKKSDQDGDSHGSTSARTRSRSGSRSGRRKKTNGRAGSGSAPSSAPNSPSKKKKETIYDVSDPLALDMLPSGPRYEPPGEDWDWHTPRAVGSGKSAISDLRRNKCSPILPKQAAEKEGGGPLVSPGGVRLNSAERLAMAIQRDQAQHAHAPHPFDQHDDDVILQSSPFKSCSVHELRASAQKKLPLSPIELEKELLRDSVKFPVIAQAASEGVLNGEGIVNKKEKKIVSKGVLKNKYINDKLENSPYGSLLPKQSQAQQSKAKHQSQHQRPAPQPDFNAGNDPYRAAQTVVAPTSTFTAMNRPARPSLQGISIINTANAGVKKSVKGESLVDIVQKAREKLRQDSNIQDEKNETSAALVAATAALGGGNHPQPTEHYTEMESEMDTDGQPPVYNKKPKAKKKFKKVKKKVAPPPAVEKEKPLEPNKEKVNKRKLIHDTYNKIMKAEITKKNADKKAAENAEADIEVPAEVVADFFAKRKKATTEDNDDENVVHQPSDEEKKVKSSLSYWTSVLGGRTEVSSPRLEDKVTKQDKAHAKSPKKTLISQQRTPQRQSLKDKDQDQAKAEEQVDQHQHFLLDEQHLQLNSSPYEEQQAQKERQEMIEQLRQEELLQQQQHQVEDGHEEDYEDDNYYDEDFEEAEVAENKPPGLAVGLNTGFRESESYGEAYEEELNMECERLRAELEKKMLAKFDL